MDGQILGFNAEEGNGAIRADDGERFSFAASEWKGTQPPKVGDKVNFVANGAVATEIYPLKTGVNVDFGAIGAKLGDKEARDKLISDVTSSQAVTWFLSKPHVIGAAIVILGWLIAGNLTMLGSIMDTSKQMDDINDLNIGGIGFLRTLGVWFLIFIYLIPILAGWLIWKAWFNAETAGDKSRTGWGAIVLPFAVPIIAMLLIFLGMPGEVQKVFFKGMRAMRGSGVSFGDIFEAKLSLILMIGGGVLILLQQYGIVKSFAPKKPDPAEEF